MYSALEPELDHWYSQRIEHDDGEIVYEAHGPKHSFVVFSGPNAKADCDLFMKALNPSPEPEV